MKPKEKVKLIWSPSLAYAIGLITTDGNLSKDKRHIHFTSKDLELVLLFKQCLCLDNNIGRKSRGGSTEKKYYVIQFGDIRFYNFLVTLGLHPAKSKTLGSLAVPSEYFADFLRGCIDGDGNINTGHHPESKNLQLRLRICSASPDFLKWLKEEIKKNFEISTGWIQKINTSRVCVLTYGKADAIKIFKIIYYPKTNNYLPRKYNIAKIFLGE